MNKSIIKQEDSNVQIGFSVLEGALQAQNLGAAWVHVRRKKGQGGADGVSPAMFGADANRILNTLAGQVRAGTYKPGPIRSFSKKKKSGGLRQISVWCLRDRVLQTAVHRQLSEVLEPTFEDSSFAYRPGRSVPMAGRRIVKHLRSGYVWVAESDIKSYFDNVPHGPLLERLYAACPEPHLLDLVALWLEAGSGQKHIGLPQGAAISPILANLYLDEIDEAMARYDVKFVRYADDFVMMCKTPELARGMLAKMSKALEPLHLWLHPNKTRISSFESGFMFLNRLFMAGALADHNDWDGLDSDERGADADERGEDAGKADNDDAPSSESLSADMGVSPAQMSALFRHFGGEELPPPATAPAKLAAILKLPLGVSEDEDLLSPEEVAPKITVADITASGAKNSGAKEAGKDVAVSPAPVSQEKMGEVPTWGSPPPQRKSDLTPLIRTLYINEPHHVLTRRNKAFSIEAHGEEIWARSVHDVDRIDIGPHAKWDKSAVKLALGSDTVMNFCSGRGEIKGVLQRPDQRYAKLQLLQARHVLDDGLSLALSRIIIAAKISNQRTVLKRWQGNLNKTKRKAESKGAIAHARIDLALRVIKAHLRPLESNADRALRAQTDKQLLGFEGDSADRFQKTMDACLIDWGIKKRSRRPALDPVNAVINWVASMLMRDMEIFIRRAGLHAGFGVLHASDDRRKACVYDLVEEFRAPVVSVVTLGLFNQNKLNKTHFYEPVPDPQGVSTDLDQREGIWITREGRTKVIRAYEGHVNARRVKFGKHKTDWRHVMQAQVRSYARHIRGLGTYMPYTVDF